MILPLIFVWFFFCCTFIRLIFAWSTVNYLFFHFNWLLSFLWYFQIKSFFFWMNLRFSDIIFQYFNARFIKTRLVSFTCKSKLNFLEWDENNILQESGFYYIESYFSVSFIFDTVEKYYSAYQGLLGFFTIF